jgi:type II secretory pathway pseudopilin PulG
MTRRLTKRPGLERGYALIMVIFLSAVMFIMAAAALPNLLTQGRRQKEEEMIWRGGQYERAVRLYYHKYGRFPQKVEDLAKANNGIRFLRQAYPDPTNKADGTWRMIYVTPAGQLIGSVRYTSLAQMNAAQHPGMPTQFGSLLPGNPIAGASGISGGPGPQGMPQTGLPPQQPGPGQVVPQSQNPGGQQQNPNQPGSFFSSSAPLQSSDLSGGPVIGGSIIGVGGTAKKASVKIFEGGKTYHDWEFIWNPLAEATIGNQTGSRPGQPIANPQNSPFGGPPTPPTPPMPQPPQNQQPPQ